MTISDTTLYITDNGRTLCGRHLGSCARHTGRDLSGQPILPCTPDVIAEAAKMDVTLRCEDCGLAAALKAETSPYYDSRA